MSEARKYGILAAFEKPEQMITALEQAINAGYKHLDTFTPFGLDEVTKLLAIQEDRWMPRFALVFGTLGVGLAFAWQTRCSVDYYPLNIGGRPYFSWPAYVMPALDFGILCAIFAIFFGMLRILRLPKFHDPIFNFSELTGASNDRFLLFIQADDPKFHQGKTEEMLKKCNPVAIEII